MLVATERQERLNKACSSMRKSFFGETEIAELGEADHVVRLEPADEVLHLFVEIG